MVAVPPEVVVDQCSEFGFVLDNRNLFGHRWTSRLVHCSCLTLCFSPVPVIADAEVKSSQDHPQCSSQRIAVAAQNGLRAGAELQPEIGQPEISDRAGCHDDGEKPREPNPECSR